MTQALVDLVGRLGYLVVFLGVGIESLGIPVPGETALVIGAVAAAQGHLHATGIFIAGFLGAVIGDNCGYWIGRRYGRRLVTLPGFRHIYTRERLEAADAFFTRRGWTAVFLGRFIALLRILAGPLAGMHGMHWPTFLVANAAGAALWVGVITAVGLLIGDNLDRAITVVSRLGYGGLALAVIVVVGVVTWRRRRTRHG